MYVYAGIINPAHVITSRSSTFCLSSAGLLTLRRFGDSFKQVTQPLQSHRQFVMHTIHTREQHTHVHHNVVEARLLPVSVKQQSKHQRSASQLSKTVCSQSILSTCNQS